MEQAQNLSFLVTSLSTTYDLRELSTEEGATVLDESSPVKVDAASGNLTACLRDDAPGATTLSITLTDSDGGVSEPLLVNLIVDYVNQKPSFTLGPPSSLGSVGEAGEAGAVAAVVVWQGEGMTSVPAFARNIFKGNPSETGQSCTHKTHASTPKPTRTQLHNYTTTHTHTHTHSPKLYLTHSQTNKCADVICCVPCRIRPGGITASELYSRICPTRLGCRPRISGGRTPCTKYEHGIHHAAYR